jgi:membrane protease YdiL (CAAX protease family)
MFAYLRQFVPPGPYTRDGVGLALLPVLVAFILLILDRFGLQSAFMDMFGNRLRLSSWQVNDMQFLAQVYFSAACLVLFVLVPLLYNRVFPLRIADPFGLAWRPAIRHMPVYLTLLALMLPVLWWAAGHPAFHQFYPMYKPSSPAMWLAFELIYLGQFFCVEFFFRGFTLFRLEQRFGLHAVSLMVVPYALLHIHKPFLEGLGSIVAGLVLGMLALKTRSIWPGLAVHGGVAFAMDWFALLRSGRMTVLWQ